MIAAILLAVRRLVFYVKQRFDCVELFLSWKRFHAAYPKGKPLKFGSAPDECAELAPDAAKLTESQKMLIDSLCQIFDGNADSILRSMLAKDVHLSPEVFLANPELQDQDLFPWRTILEKKAEEEAAQNVQQIIAAPQETESQPSQPPSTPAPTEDHASDVEARMAEREASWVLRFALDCVMLLQ